MREPFSVLLKDFAFGKVEEYISRKEFSLL